ncbi:ribosome silencing factor [Oxalobacter vibrioformis]|uniref:Ribosomal silencing factor RsfS n=1 Tax=Oxalobacter vibrioformis TaxID=933080 RepID=A0A9E9LVN7_9BURK|nr:ribosome silencing factor [Oxalobacter vibrioformis]WAW10580.1 ribosome silencing factor [Oxalobacter vibrioformis]
MNIKKLQTIIIEALEDVKAVDIALFDTSKLTSMFDRLVIASGTSNRQTKALAASVRDKVRQAGGTVVGMEGEDAGEWVLVDVGDIVVHIMQPPIRAYYQLEEIWGGKKIDLDKARETAKPKTVKSKTAVAKPAGKAAAPKKRATPVKKAATSTAEKPKTAKKSTAALSKTAAAPKKTVKSPAVAPKKTGTRKKPAE